MRMGDIDRLIANFENAVCRYASLDEPQATDHHAVTSNKAELRAGIIALAKERRDHALDAVHETIRILKAD